LADPATSEIVVAVDGTGDGSYDVAVGLKDSRVVAFEQTQSGPHAARAAAVKRASGEIVLLLDDDVVAGQGLVTGHALHHRELDRLVVLGYMPVVDAATGPAIPALSRIYATEYEAHCREIENDPRLVLLHLWGGNMSMRRSDYLLVDTEEWKDDHEDQFFGIRCHQAGLRGVFDRSLYAEHWHRRDAAAFLRTARRRGVARWQLQTLFPELLGSPDPDWVCSGLPVPARWLVRWSGTTQRARYVVGPVVQAARVAHRLRLEQAESTAYRFARRVELQAGTRWAINSWSPDPGLVARPDASMPGVESS
jgi:glycosyltransferase involved in cell wall biosynthesis